MNQNSALKPVLYAPTAGYLFTYYNSKLSKEREAQIDRVNAQVGPSQHRSPGICLQHAPALPSLSTGCACQYGLIRRIRAPR
jgi:hypothetical protein